MILAIDIGNTHSEIGLYADTEYVDSWRVTTRTRLTEDELMVSIDHFLAFKSLKRDVIEDIAVASVVPPISQIFQKVATKYFAMQALCVHHELDLGIKVDYHPASSVGADRLCNAVAAFEKYGGPAIVIDFGTATTLDVVNKEGIYLGGAIAPGLETAAWGLYARASKLPRISLEFPEQAIGKNSESSMQSGIILGAIKMVDGLIEAMKLEVKGEPVLVMTGGLSTILAPRSRFVHYIEPHLVLDGLIKIYMRNKDRLSVCADKGK